MRFSRANHFWTWFQRNINTYLEMPKGSQAQALYWMRELVTHLAACGKGIEAEIFWGHPDRNDDIITMTITAYGKARNFRKVDQLLAKAPDISGWKFEALQPPREIDYFMQEDFGHLHIDPFNWWFYPPDDAVSQDKEWLYVYIEMYPPCDIDRLKQAVRAAVFNVLGERVYGLRIGGIELVNLLEVPKAKRKELVNLQHLPRYIKAREMSSMVVTEGGMMKQGKW